jgi:hypothetical protein
LAALELVPCAACGVVDPLCEGAGVVGVDAVTAGTGAGSAGAGAGELLFTRFDAAGSEVAGARVDGTALLSASVVGVATSVTPTAAVGAESDVPTLSVSTDCPAGAAAPEPTRAAAIPTLNVGPGAS